MNAKILSTIVAGLTFGVGPAANATDWADFSPSNRYPVRLTSLNREDTTVLQTVTAVCPSNGYLIAQAQSQFGIVPFFANYGSVGYSLTVDSVAPIAWDINHLHFVDGNDPDGLMYRPGGIQRIVSCTAGQSVTVNFVAWREYAGHGTYALHPMLSVDFFEKRI